jgi:hypothetical protein
MNCITFDAVVQPLWNDIFLRGSSKPLFGSVNSTVRCLRGTSELPLSILLAVQERVASSSSLWNISIIFWLLVKDFGFFSAGAKADIHRVLFVLTWYLNESGVYIFITTTLSVNAAKLHEFWLGEGTRCAILSYVWCRRGRTVTCNVLECLVWEEAIVI